MTLTKNVYALPFRKKDLIVAISDPRAHFAHFKHAIDFALPEGAPLLAVKAGKVIDLKVDSKEGGADPKYADIKYLNYITLEHSTGEFSQYLHIKHKSAKVKVDDKVKQGQIIALSGNTGFSTASHLHFQVFRLVDTDIGWDSLQIRFKERVYVRRKPKSIPKEMKKAMKELERAKKSLR